MLHRGKGIWLAMVTCVAVVIGCRDDSAPTAAGAAAPSTALAVIESGDLTDPLIDPTDSHLVTTSVTRTSTIIESADPFVDPLTGHEVTRLELPEVIDSTRFEAGYDVEGTIRLTESHAGNDSGGPAARVRIVGNVATFYDKSGAVVHDTSGPILMDAIGSTDNVIVTDEAVFRTDEPPPVASRAAAKGEISGDPSSAREEKRGDKLYRSWSLDDPASGVRGERTRNYRRSDDRWVLTEEREQRIQSVGRISYTTVQTSVYPVVKWKNDEAKDARRREKASQRPVIEAPLAVVSETPIATAPVTCLLCASQGDGDGSGLSGSVTSGTGLNVVFQHGGFADASAWYRMDPWISARYPIARKVKPSLNWRAGIETQAGSLKDEMLTSGGSGYLMIGHSNGGLISRRVGQMDLQTGGPLVNGVIAVASPHLGLPLARNSRAVVSSQLSNYLNTVLAQIGGSCWRKEFAWLCPTLNDALLTLVPRIVNFAFDATVPMSSDVKPGSVFLTQLNARNEAFLKYSVEVESQGAWKFIRMMGDWRCEPEDRCSGHHLQNAMESIYDVLRVCGSNEIVRIMKAGLAEKCHSVRWSLSALNLTYERLTSPNDGSDGLVPAKSQRYPGALEQDRTLMRNARESHVGELKSNAVKNAITGLIDHYRIQPT